MQGGQTMRSSTELSMVITPITTKTTFLMKTLVLILPLTV